MPKDIKHISATSKLKDAHRKKKTYEHMSPSEPNTHENRSNKNNKETDMQTQNLFIYLRNLPKIA
jgi:hypothetical protein